MLMIGMVMRVSIATIARWARLFAVVVAAVFLTAVSFVVQACGGGHRNPSGQQDAGRDAGTDAGADAGRDSGADAGRDSGVDAGRDAEVPRDAGRDAEPIRDADLPDVPLE